MSVSKNKLIIAAAGSGKTTFLVNEALKQTNEKVLITTYTIANEYEIKRKIIEIRGCIPENITVQTWFSFLLQHGVRPFQGCLYEENIQGMILVNTQSAVKYKNKAGIAVCYNETNELEDHYFTKAKKIYSDKLSKFVIRVNTRTSGATIDRLTRIYKHIYIDEVQDLAGYDLEFLKLLFKSKSSILLVGDPRQVTYLTHNERKYAKYTNGKIKDFILNECKKLNCEIDETSLNTSHRNNLYICDLSQKLYPQYNPCFSGQNNTTEHDGIFLVRNKDVGEYLKAYSPVQLRLNKDTKGINLDSPVYNFGESKGLSFDRVLIYPTWDMGKWFFNNTVSLADKTRAQLYVAITRARYSVGIVFDYEDTINFDGIKKYI